MKNEAFLETRLSSQNPFKGRLLDVREDLVRLPNGKSATREYIVHPGAAAVVPLFENGDTLLVRQFRYPINESILEVPAGKLDRQEDPLSCAKRELTEETGYEALTWHSLNWFHPGVGYSDEVIHLYLAEDLEHVGSNLDDDEFLEHLRLPFLDALELLVSGKISDGKSCVALFRAAIHLKLLQKTGR